MFVFKIFMFFASISTIILIFYFLNLVINVIRKKFSLHTVLRKIFLTSLLIAAAIFTLASILPYMLNMRDAFVISSSEKNIVLLQEYIDTYEAAAKKQIEEYADLQKEMAMRASQIQLQYWSKQIDEVGNALTDRLKEFNDNIMSHRIVINERDAKIEGRRKNKFFFGLED